MTNIIPFVERKKNIGDPHEDRTEEALRKRGYAVARADVTNEEIRRTLSRTDSFTRYDPDFIAACGSTICYVDAKATLRGPESDYVFVNGRAVEAHIALVASRGIPVYYVFDDMTVLTPAEVIAHAGLHKYRSSGGYVRLARGLGHSFDEIFGLIHPPTWGADPLYRAA